MAEDRQAWSEGHRIASALTPTGNGTEASLRKQLIAAWDEVKALRRTVAHQAALLKNLASETSPTAPSLNCVYWLFSLAHEHEPSWVAHRNRLLPSLAGLGTMAAPDVTPLAWARHLTSRRPFACDYTLNLELSRLKAMLDFAVENEMIAFNPLRAAKPLKAKSRRETELRPDDIDRILEAAEDVTDLRLCEGDDDGRRAKTVRAFVLCCFDSMLRFSEAHALNRDAISAEGDVTVLGKGKKLRTVRLTARTLEALRELPGRGRAFTDSAGTLRRWFRRACELGRLDSKATPQDKRIVVHHMRHAGATAADAAGVRPSALQLTLGHASLETTERYLHRDKLAAAREVAEAMERRPPKRVTRKKK